MKTCKDAFYKSSNAVLKICQIEEALRRRGRTREIAGEKTYNQQT
jgi:hypothetical protein